MSRRRAAEKRKILPDHKFKDLVIAKFMNRIMLDGKKSISEKIVYGAFDILSKKIDKEPLKFFQKNENGAQFTQIQYFLLYWHFQKHFFSLAFT